jgi:hypothetical protein
VLGSLAGIDHLMQGTTSLGISAATVPAKCADLRPSRYGAVCAGGDRGGEGEDHQASEEQLVDGKGSEAVGTVT